MSDEGQMQMQCNISHKPESNTNTTRRTRYIISLIQYIIHQAYHIRNIAKIQTNHIKSSNQTGNFTPVRSVHLGCDNTLGKALALGSWLNLKRSRFKLKSLTMQLIACSSDNCIAGSALTLLLLSSGRSLIHAATIQRTNTSTSRALLQQGNMDRI